MLEASGCTLYFLMQALPLNQVGYNWKNRAEELIPREVCYLPRIQIFHSSPFNSTVFRLLLFCCLHKAGKLQRKNITPHIAMWTRTIVKKLTFTTWKKRSCSSPKTSLPQKIRDWITSPVSSEINRTNSKAGWKYRDFEEKHRMS